MTIEKDKGTEMPLKRKTLGTIALIAVLAASLLAVPSARAEQKVFADRLALLNDVTHVYGFFYAWKSFFGRAYLADETMDMSASHRTISSIDFEPYNLFWMPLGDRDLPYADGDAEHVKEYVRDGGGLFIFEAFNKKDENMPNANGFAKHFGFQLTTDQVATPIKLLDHPTTKGVEGVQIRGGHALKLENPAEWTMIATDAKGNPVIAARDLGDGRVVASGLNFFLGQKKDKEGNLQEAPNRAFVQKLFLYAAAGKEAPEREEKLPFKLPPEQTKELGKFVMRYNEYLEPYVDMIAELYQELNPKMREWTGVPLVAGGDKLEIHLLTTGGGGWSVGEKIGLGAFWGGYPEHETGMIGLMGHELCHSWVLPHQEVIDNEGIAIYAGYKMGILLGAEDAEEQLRRKTEAYAKKLPTEAYDPVEGKIINGPYMVILSKFEKEYGEDVTAKYFRLKRELVPAENYKFTAHDTAWLWGRATGEDQFEYFRSLGMSVDPAKVTIPAAEEEAETATN